jgi:hypothetical protein
MGKRVFDIGAWVLEETGGGGAVRVVARDPPPAAATWAPAGRAGRDEYPRLWLTRSGFVAAGSVRSVVCEDGAWCHVDPAVAAALLRLQAPPP